MGCRAMQQVSAGAEQDGVLGPEGKTLSVVLFECRSKGILTSSWAGQMQLEFTNSWLHRYWKVDGDTAVGL